MIEKELTGEIIRTFYKVYNALRYGFTESIYHNSMIIELVSDDFTIETEKQISVYYKEHIVGTFAADLVVEGKVILELKAKESIVEAHEVQRLNYLRSTPIEVGLLLNFGKQPEFKRKYFSNDKKTFGSQHNDDGLFKSLFEKDPPRSV
ncbi:MAG: GxxExxY protein [Acidobacteria bacterium]|nr:GxxExxY protein [Acidobacteriota bacterium]